MKFKALLIIGHGLYYTEWFDTKEELDTFLKDAERERIEVRWVENEVGDVL